MSIWMKNIWHQFCLVLELGRNKKRDYKLVVFSTTFKLFHVWHRAIALSSSYSAYSVQLCIWPWEMNIICTRFHFCTIYQYCQLQMSSSVIHNLFIYLFSCSCYLSFLSSSGYMTYYGHTFPDKFTGNMHQSMPLSWINMNVLHIEASVQSCCQAGSTSKANRRFTTMA
jgi:hypothetical protein